MCSTMSRRDFVRVHLADRELRRVVRACRNEHRLVADDLVLVTSDPEQRRGSLDIDECARIAIHRNGLHQ